MRSLRWSLLVVCVGLLVPLRTGLSDSPFVRGDADANGEVELTDAVFTLEDLFRGKGPLLCLDAADSDDNGEVELTDAVNTLSVLYLGTGEIPPPNECGDDPTTDDLLTCEIFDFCPEVPPNTPPVADAGPDVTVTEGDVVLLDGSGSSDADDDPLAFLWMLVALPQGSAAVLAGAETATPSFAADLAGEYIAELVVSDGEDDSAPDSVTVLAEEAGPPLPPDPSEVAPPLPDITDFHSATEFLYSGDDPIQTGVAPGTIELRRAAVLRGKVLRRDDTPLSGVKISVLGRPEFGETLSRSDGMFDLAVNGGGAVTLRYEKPEFCSAQRRVDAPWANYAILPDVVMVPADPVVTLLTVGEGSPMQVARGSVQADTDGERRATLLFPAGTSAELVMPDGSVVPADELSIRATEFTVGENGPAAMPAELPPSSGYTYAVELSADEAVAAGASSVQLSQPVYHYVENFLGFPVGMAVPAGFYDRERGVWVASENGRVVEIVAIEGGLAGIDTDGDGVADNDAELGVTDAERQELGGLYDVGQALWRVPITHFTPWDLNYPYGPAEDAVTPDLIVEFEKPEEGCEVTGSVIEAQDQVLREAIPVSGTPFLLHYSSARVAGFKAARTLNIPLSGESVPDSLTGIRLSIRVAGRRFDQSFPPEPNQRTTFTWDGKDAYGRTLSGKQPVTVRLGYVYQAVYQEPSGVAAAFAVLSGRITGVKSRREFTVWRDWRGELGLIANRAGLGGWTLSVHHAQDPGENMLYLGTGARRPVEAIGSVITTVAGSGIPGFSGEDEPALGARMNRPSDVAIGEDGSIYIADRNNSRIRRVSPDGMISTVAGTGGASFGGDGGPATEGMVKFPPGVAVGPDGSVYIADEGNNRVRRVSPGADGIVTGEPDEIITTIAGTGVEGTTGDGGPATLARVQSVSSITVSSSGDVYFGQQFNNLRVRKVGTDGIITTVAGTGACCFSGDGGPADEAAVPVQGLAVRDGSIYVASGSNRTVRRISVGGTISAIAGGLGGAWGVAVDRDGVIYVSTVFFNDHRVYRVEPDGGGKTPLAGTGAAGFGGDEGPALFARLAEPLGLAVGPDGDLYIAEASNQRIRRVTLALGGSTDLLVPSQDGTELYLFSSSGRHLETRDALTDAVIYEFGYGSGGLSSITDGYGNVTAIERDESGEATAIVGPFGHRTATGFDEDGRLAEVTDPLGSSARMAYDEDGLLTSFTDPRGTPPSLYEYDDMGRLVRAEDPAGGVQTFSREVLSTATTRSYAVTRTTAMGRVTTYGVEESVNSGTRRFVNTFPSGEASELLVRPDGTEVTSQPDGSSTTLTFGPDPRFGMRAPLPAQVVVAASTDTQLTSGATRAVVLGDPNDPRTVQAMTVTHTINGDADRVAFDATDRTVKLTSAAGRQLTIVLNEQGDISSVDVPGLAPLTREYDENGRVMAITQGSDADERKVLLDYDEDGLLRQITDPLGRVTVLDGDDAGRLTKATLPGPREIEVQYDANDNLTAVIPPGRPFHRFAYSAVNQVSEYGPPDIGLPATETSFTYNLDRQLISVTTPDGEVISLTYEDGGDCVCGRLAEVTHAEGTIELAYDPVSGHVASLTATDGGTLTLEYDGALVTGMAWAGAVSGRVDYTYDNDLRLASISVNGSGVVEMSYDPDGLLVQAGGFVVERDPQLGLITATTLGSVSTSRAYNVFGESTSQSVTVADTPLLETVCVRDKLGRITETTETVQGEAHTFEYEYDLAGRLEEVRRDGVVEASFTYDTNGNRATGPDPALAYTYDDQDRLLTRNGTAYTYTASGALETKTAGGATTSYHYDALGNLREVELPGGRRIEYVIDGDLRRIGKRVDGAIVQGFLYESSIRPIAELDGAGNVVSRFVFALRPNVPDYMTRGGSTYRIVADELGSPRLVIDVATGEVAQRMDYDAFGNVVADTNPGFQPFGFAGGLYDTDTGLTRFGFRDYEAASGRWTARDPGGFGSGPNLYRYADNDPVNLFDPLGDNPLEPAPGTMEEFIEKVRRDFSGDAVKQRHIIDSERRRRKYAQETADRRNLLRKEAVPGRISENSRRRSPRSAGARRQRRGVGPIGGGGGPSGAAGADCSFKFEFQESPFGPIARLRDLIDMITTPLPPIRNRLTAFDYFNLGVLEYTWGVDILGKFDWL